ncbi:MAG: tRNA epoxyqueuosine(34) reductase QueG [Candidatus Omnitrophica bacterium]|nr:tRNA epoxyqueuosine(34) reductase QueG [Candidatus Omnitrophota bacterium]
MTPKQPIIRYAIHELGFDDCRFTSPFVDQELNAMRQWLNNHRHGDMDYLQRHLPFKEDPNQMLDQVRTAIIVIKNYKNTKQQTLNQKFKIARYAAGKDYHLVIGEKLDQLSQFISKHHPRETCVWGIDSKPIAERTLAAKSGIGFIGKNSMLIKPGLGSYFFIGVVFTTLSIERDPLLKWDCGQCRLCLDACPTGALHTPFEVDSPKCISYQTIEQKQPMTPKQMMPSQDWLFGCDICQEVCPYNHPGIPMTSWNEFLPTSGIGFEAFSGDRPPDIPKHTPLYRSRKRILPNWENRKNP